MDTLGNKISLTCQKPIKNSCMDYTNEKVYRFTHTYNNIC